MLLFTALLPPAAVVEPLRAELARLGAGENDEVRWSASDRWHVTLGFYGDQDDPAQHVELLTDRLRGRGAPRLWLQGAGIFPGVLWLGVAGMGLTDLADAAGAGQEGREYRPHLTLGRWSRAVPAVGTPWQQRLARYRSEPWTAGEVVLMRSDRAEGEPVYRVIERFQLTCG
jgi:2'-5' RNA ligase